MGHMQRMFFYVPRGTKQLVYFWEGPPHEVCDPAGKVIAKVTTSGKFVTVPVPPGGAGQAWSFTKMAGGHLWLMNAPGYLAASPDALLVPREVAARDQVARP
jgi:hypothetical protein